MSAIALSILHGHAEIERPLLVYCYRFRELMTSGHTCFLSWLIFNPHIKLYSTVLVARKHSDEVNTLNLDICIVSALFVCIMIKSGQNKAENVYFKIIHVINYKSVWTLFTYVSNFSSMLSVSRTGKNVDFQYFLFK